MNTKNYRSTHSETPTINRYYDCLFWFGKAKALYKAGTWYFANGDRVPEHVEVKWR